MLACRVCRRMRRREAEMPDCCGDGNFCDFPYCDCDGNADWLRKHKTNSEAEPIQDCGEPWCNYCLQVIRPKAAALGVTMARGNTNPPAATDGTDR